MCNRKRLAVIGFCVLLGLTALNVVLRAAQGESPWEPLRSFAVSAGELLLLACGIIALMLRLAYHVNRGTDAGKRYTRIMVPSFLFILFADIFFTVVSVLQGGIFRGWLSRLKPTGGCEPAVSGKQ